MRTSSIKTHTDGTLYRVGNYQRPKVRVSGDGIYVPITHEMYLLTTVGVTSQSLCKFTIGEFGSIPRDLLIELEPILDLIPNCGAGLVHGVFCPRESEWYLIQWKSVSNDPQDHVARIIYINRQLKEWNK